MKDYFNTYEFTEAKKMLEINPNEAITRLKNYIEKHPKDYHAYTYLAGALAYITKLDEAEKIIDYVEKIASKDNAFNQSENKVRKFTRDINFVRLKVWSYSGKYSKAYNYCKKNRESLRDLDTLNLEFYLKKKLNLAKKTRNSTSYLFNQMVEYKEEDFIEHLHKHMANYNIDKENPNTNIFLSNIDVLKLFEEVKKYIPSNKKIFSGFYEDLYIFRYDGCGKENFKIANFIKVYLIHNTKHFITMLPTINLDNLPYVDLNYLVKEEETKNIKRLSQIDKFNKRFNKN